jgi:biopolymer transport protein ExbB
MISKKLALVAAIVLMSGFGAGQVLAQGAEPAAPPAAGAPAPDAAAPAPAPEAAPAPAAPAAEAAAPAAPASNPYNLEHMWNEGNIVSRSILIILEIMSAGTWFIFFAKFFEQTKILSQAKLVDKSFWTSATLNEGIEKLPKNSMFRAVAESGVKASAGGTSLVGLNDWIAMSMQRQLEDANARLQGGVAFLASVGSTSPFVGLAGTVWGILNALIAIGASGQPDIGKVAGPVGEALIMTFIGLGVAIPAVLLYNYVVRRNKIIGEKLRSFAGDLQSYLITKAK